MTAVALVVRGRPPLTSPPLPLARRFAPDPARRRRALPSSSAASDGGERRCCGLAPPSAAAGRPFAGSPRGPWRRRWRQGPQFHRPTRPFSTFDHDFRRRCGIVGSQTFSAASRDDSHDDDPSDPRLRVAIVGGGAAGMCAALHLSPLVAAGSIRGPVDVYESSVVTKSKHGRASEGGEGGKGSKRRGGPQPYPGSGASGREIGVGIWSTAWWSFLRSLERGGANKDRASYRTLLRDLEACGSYVDDVGYRTPNGEWMVRSELNATPFGVEDLDPKNREGGTAKEHDGGDPALLFVRERDLLSCLRNAIKIEKKLGTVRYHSGVRVEGIDDVEGDLGSLVLANAADNGGGAPYLSPRYHLIVAADGLHSSLRSRFAGHRSTHATGTGLESSSRSSPETTAEYDWEHTQGQREATQVEDREYVVFRGNAPKLEKGEEDGSGSFQTWGEERSMRFAAVPFYHETEDLEDEDEDDLGNAEGRYSKSRSFASKKKDEEVWFATISDPTILASFSESADDAVEQKQRLMKAFGSWHKPVQKLIETTPAEDIMYERAVAHRHIAGPVFDVARILEFEARQERKMAKEGDAGTNDDRESPRPDLKIHGRGPMITFLGDALMTVDPVLAQGFTVAMEAGASVARSVERVLVPAPGHASSPGSSAAGPAYRPELLREELTRRHYQRERRLLQLLRSTELVQRMAQPQSGFGSALATWIVRPLVKLCPEVVKKRVFDYMIRYSLGLTGGDRDGGDGR
ncbi:hypothetical protein ACHAWF_015481 [Thalassiosira exigua]